MTDTFDSSAQWDQGAPGHYTPRGSWDSVDVAAPPSWTGSTRTARLVLGGLTLWLDDHAVGYTCTSLEVTSPEVRTVTQNRAGAHGVDDETRLFAGRTVTANIIAWDENDNLDDIVDLFMPFMDPDTRPALVFTQHSENETERELTLVPSGFASPMTSVALRAVTLSWDCPDATFQSPERHLTFQGVPSPAVWVDNRGDMPIGPVFSYQTPPAPNYAAFNRFRISGQTYDAGNTPISGWNIYTANAAVTVPNSVWIDFDSETHQVTRRDTGGAIAGLLDPVSTTWPHIPAGGRTSVAQTETGGITKLIHVTWRDRFLA